MNTQSICTHCAKVCRIEKSMAPRNAKFRRNICPWRLESAVHILLRHLFPETNMLAVPIRSCYCYFRECSHFHSSIHTRSLFLVISMHILHPIRGIFLFTDIILPHGIITPVSWANNHQSLVPTHRPRILSMDKHNYP